MNIIFAKMSADKRKSMRRNLLDQKEFLSNIKQTVGRWSRNVKQFLLIAHQLSEIKSNNETFNAHAIGRSIKSKHTVTYLMSSIINRCVARV